MKPLIIGTGFVANAYARAFQHLGFHPMMLSRKWIDYYDADKLKFFIQGYKPTEVFNCAGYTGRTVDDCETNVSKSREANLFLPHIIASICDEFDLPMIHISSGCMFNGAYAFPESSAPNFTKNIYQKHKFNAELAVRSACPTVWIYRIRMPFSYFNHKRNWLTKLLNYEKIVPGANSLTFIDEFAMRSCQLHHKAEPGIYHAAYGSITAQEVAQMLCDAGLRKLPIKLWDEDEFLQLHVPRSAAVLDCSKFEKAYGAKFGDVRCALRWCIEQMRNGSDTMILSAKSPAQNQFA